MTALSLRVPRRLARLVMTGALVAGLVFAAIFTAGIARAADTLVGGYTVKGWDPNEADPKDRSYKGTATLTVRGGALAYAGSMDGYRYTGTGLYDPKTATLALHFREEKTGRSGIALFRHTGNRLEGTWTWHGEPAGKIGRETWVRK